MIAVKTLRVRRKNDVCAPWARRVRAVNTLQQQVARRSNVIDAIKTLCGSCRNVICYADINLSLAVGTNAITGKLDILGVFRGDPTARWQVFRTLYNAVASPFGVTGA